MGSGKQTRSLLQGQAEGMRIILSKGGKEDILKEAECRFPMIKVGGWNQKSSRMCFQTHANRTPRAQVF